MTIRSVLMPFASHANGRERLQAAINIAKYFEAHLDVLHAQVNPKQLLPNEKKLLSNELYKKIDQLITDYIDDDILEFRDIFEELASKQNILLQARAPHQRNTAMWHNTYGFRGDLVAEKGKLSDLTIVPKALRGKSSISFEAAILYSGKPVLVMPREQTHFNPEIIAIAWNSDTQAVRAVQAAFPLLQKASQVIIITSERSLKNKPSQQELKKYLEIHGIASDTCTFQSSRMRTPSALLQCANELEVDLIVCGAYTHHKMNQQILGGVTQGLLKHSNLPLFMIN